ncbi:natural killer cells antigen CD94-like isoform X1 [Ornithorhynchus anatinus]|uniref:Natural killer cells antigen CD94 n=1 Tax=Ornithorhynchus anatinus TaxID=9258 RepID=F6TDE9_ORNAN|nr:natural killer cells antigen CD94-like isoform X1 [Ornithorhynchus anatinus]
MSEQTVVYTELKAKKSSQPLPKRPKTDKNEDSAREHELTYTELKLPRPSPQQSRRVRVKGKDTSTSLWRLITVILGSFCLVLLATTCVLTTQVLQGASSNITTNQTGHHCSPCPENWFLYRNNCYLFSKEKRKWNESRAICRSHNSGLLKIENKGELDFLSLFALYGWTGLYRSGRNQTWKWSDGSNLSIGLLHITLDESGKDCAKYHPSNPASPEECESLQKYICKYRIP